MEGSCRFVPDWAAWGKPSSWKVSDIFDGNASREYDRTVRIARVSLTANTSSGWRRASSSASVRSGEFSKRLGLPPRSGVREDAVPRDPQSPVPLQECVDAGSDNPGHSYANARGTHPGEAVVDDSREEGITRQQVEVAAELSRLRAQGHREGR